MRSLLFTSLLAGVPLAAETYTVYAKANQYSHVFSAHTDDEAIEPHDIVEIAEARWGTLEELADPLRERLLATGRAFWRYRVALHDAALDAIGRNA